ncbi:hypothetical protein [Undibacterium sp. Ji49W]|uniref:hypothetical protein n=1 Tax=Undibacterium sp. Ji49W TaxID=3413040 RepID=UPI003BF1FE82
MQLYPWRMVCLLPLIALSGCGNMLTNQIKSDLTVAKACQEIQANQAGYVATSKEAFIANIKTRLLGEVMNCDISPLDPGETKLQSVLLCGLQDIKVLNAPFKIESEKEKVQKAVQEKINEIRDAMLVIQTNFKSIEKNWKENEDNCDRVDKCVNLYAGVILSTNGKVQIKKISDEFDKIRKHFDELRSLIETAEKDILAAGQSDEIQLLADAKRVLLNAKIFISNAGRSLTGDIAMATRDAILDNVYYELSHRSLNSIDASLSRAEKLLDKADDKVYGAISLGLFFGKGKIQDGLDNVTAELVCKVSDAGGLYMRRLTFAMAQAACERMADNSKNKSVYLAPMLEESWAKAVYANSNNEIGDEFRAALSSKCKIVREQQAKIQLTQEHAEKEQSEIAQHAKNESAIASIVNDKSKNKQAEIDHQTIKLLHKQGDGKQSKVSFTDEQVANKIDENTQALTKLMNEGQIFRTYVGHEWAAGLALTPVNMIELVKGNQTDTKLVASPPMKADVAALALAASSNTVAEWIGGAAGVPPQNTFQTQPSMLKNAVESVNLASIQATQVSVQQNSIQNVNVAPAQSDNKIYIGGPFRSARAQDLCDQLPSWLVCRRLVGQRFEIEVPRFDDGKYQDAAAFNVLALIVRASKAGGAQYVADIQGFASSNEFSCKQADKWLRLEGHLPFTGAQLSSKRTGMSLSYQSKQTLAAGTANCANSAIDGNQFLSFARAAWTASVLDDSAGSTIEVKSVAGFGAKLADRNSNMYDRKVVIELTHK